MRRKVVDGREGVKLRGELEGGRDQVRQDYVGDAGVVGYGRVGGGGRTSLAGVSLVIWRDILSRFHEI